MDTDGLASPSRVKAVNAWLTAFWLLNFPPIIVLYFVMSETKFASFTLFYLALVSIWANVAGHFSAWVSGRVEVKQDES